MNVSSIIFSIVNFGNFDVDLEIKKNDTKLELDNGILTLTPNINLYKLIEEEISEKYKIKINGHPEFKNGQISIIGEARSRTGQFFLLYRPAR